MLISKLNRKLKKDKIILKAKTKKEVLATLKMNYQKYKDKINYLTDNNLSLENGDNDKTKNPSKDNNNTDNHLKEQNKTKGDNNPPKDSNHKTPQKKDTTPPTITLKGDNPQVIEFGSTYQEFGADVSDNKDKNVVLNIDKSNLNLEKVGEYNVIYTAKDKAGNKAKKIRVVKVIDTTAPTISLKGDKNITLEAGSKYIELGFEAIDNYDGNITSNVKIQNNLNASKVGSFTIIYSVKDSSGNEANTSRVVKVVDTIPPTITLKGDNPLKVIWKSDFIDPGVKVSDNADKNPNVEVIGEVNISLVQDFTLKYIATDKAGNKAEVSRVVKVYKTKEQIENLTKSYKENYYDKAVEVYNKEHNNSWTHPYVTYKFPNNADFEPGTPPDEPITSNEWMEIAGVGFSKKLSIDDGGPYVYTKELVKEWKAKGMRAGRFHISFASFLDKNDSTGYKLDKNKLKILKDACELFIDEDIPILISTGSSGDEFVDFNKDWEGSMNHIIDWWRQLAEYFKDTSYLLAFENFIEYHGFDHVPLENTFSAKIDANESRYPAFNTDARRAIDNYVKEIGYNNLNAEMSKVVRVTNPKRIFIFKPRGIGRNNLSSITPWRWGTEIDPYPNNHSSEFYWLISSGGGANLRATYVAGLRENKKNKAKELINEAAYKSWQPVLKYHNITQLPVWISLMGIKLDQEVVDDTLGGIAPTTDEVVSYLNWYLDSIQTLSYNKQTMKRDRIPNGFQQSWWLWDFKNGTNTWQTTTIYDWEVAPILDSLSKHSFGGNLTPKYYPPAFLQTSKTIVREGVYANGEYKESIFNEAISDKEDTISFKKLSGPSWLEVLANGEIKGTPSIDDVGENNFSVAVVGKNGDMDTKALQVVVTRYEHLNILPSDDAICKKDAPEQNFGSDSRDALIASDKDNAQLAYLKFKVNTSKTIKSATLHLYIVGRNVYINIYKAPSSWSEKDINWQNRPNDLEKIETIKINSKSGSYYDFDLSDIITQSGEYSFVIETTKKDAQIYFKESDKAPKLELEVE